MLQSKAGYIDARPLSPSRRNPLATDGRTIQLGHKRALSLHFRMSALPPEADIAERRCDVLLSAGNRRAAKHTRERGEYAPTKAQSVSLGCRCYSILRPSFLTSALHLPSSRSMLAAYSSGVLGIGPPPSEIRRIFTSSELTIWRSSLLRRWTIAGDVPVGTSSP